MKSLKRNLLILGAILGFVLITPMGMAESGVSYKATGPNQAYACSNSGITCENLCKSLGKVSFDNKKYKKFEGTFYNGDTRKKAKIVKRICGGYSTPTHYCVFENKPIGKTCGDTALSACLCKVK